LQKQTYLLLQCQMKEKPRIWPSQNCQRRWKRVPTIWIMHESDYWNDSIDHQSSSVACLPACMPA
jgi:hypothetical protein